MSTKGEFSLPLKLLILANSETAKGNPFRLKTPPNGRKLTPTEEQTIVRYILDLDFARICAPAV
jgi:hypothetical protein